jgi:hypothetical protein
MNISAKKLNIYLSVLIAIFAIFNVVAWYPVLQRHLSSTNDTSGPDYYYPDDPDDQTNLPGDGDDMGDVNIDDVEFETIGEHLLQGLRFPSANGNWDIPGNLWQYLNVTVSGMSRDFKMRFAADGIEGTEIGDEIPGLRWSRLVPATEVQASFRTLFGPDVAYTDGNVGDGIVCAHISEYRPQDQAYVLFTECGGDSPFWWHNETQFIRAEQSGNEIHAYFYVQPYITVDCLNTTGFCFDNRNTDDLFLFKRAHELQFEAPLTGFTRQLRGGFINGTNADESARRIIRHMMKDGEVDVYRFTFRRQSDGNFYFSSGQWV